jgi:large subunit ribosomal protein L3
MTQIFGEDGTCIPVTAIELGPCYVLNVKNREKHGYGAVQLGFEPKRSDRLNKPERGQFAAAGKGCFVHVREMRCDVETLGWGELGKELHVQDVFRDGDIVDITGTSLGRGFAGVVKRYHVKGKPSTHGTHENQRHIGSIGSNKTPSRVYKNHHMPGHMGNSRVTIQNLKVMKVKGEDNLLLVRGGIPGCKGGLVMVRKAMKARPGQAQS